MDKIKLNNANISIYIALGKLWKLNTAFNVTANRQKLVYIGHGLGETKWKGWAWKLLRIEWIIKKVRNCF